MLLQKLPKYDDKFERIAGTENWKRMKWILKTSNACFTIEAAESDHKTQKW